MAPLKLALLGLFHESNSFSPLPTDIAACTRAGILRGSEISRYHDGAGSTVAGLLATGRLPGVEVVPLIFCAPQPAGPITSEAFEAMVGEMIDLLQGDRWDGVLLALHGAATTTDLEDADGEIARRVRAAVGPQTPIGLACDLHGNVSAQLARSSDVLIAYRTNPHVDAYERATEVGELVVRAARGEIKPVQAYVHVPILLNILRQNTEEEPMRTLLTVSAEVRRTKGILATSVLEGFPYADVEHAGMAVTVTADQDLALARAAANELAELAWNLRGRATGSGAVSVEEALDLVDRSPGPVLLLDVGDNIGAGTTGRGASILAAAEKRRQSGLLTLIVAPEAVRDCERAGIGGEVSVTVGDPHLDHPMIPLRGTVRRFHPGTFDDPNPTHAGYTHFDVGPTAVLDLASGNVVILISNAIMQSSLEQLRCLDIEPTDFKAITAKGVQSPLPAYGKIAKTIVRVDTDGQACADLRRLKYRRLRRPVWPLSPDAVLSTSEGSPQPVTEP